MLIKPVLKNLQFQLGFNVTGFKNTLVLVMVNLTGFIKYRLWIRASTTVYW